MQPKSIPRLVIAGAGSGVGKTTLLAALARAFRARGLRVQCFKCGPDYLDPTWHRMASGRDVQNLDTWMMGRDAVQMSFQQATRDADLALIEGVMGLFDGADPRSNMGSSAEIAELLKAPVICVLDAKGVARTLLPLYLGLKNFSSELNVKGLIANRVGSRGHLDLLQKACGDDLLGGLPVRKDLGIPERHLGLHAAFSDPLQIEKLDQWAELAKDWLDLDRLWALAQEAGEQALSFNAKAPKKLKAPCRLAIARDEAFHFYYDYNLQLLEEAGAELLPFSPLRDDALPDAVQGIIFGGGYPELYAAELSSNTPMLSSIRNYAAKGGLILAECGGLMYLCRSIKSLAGEDYPMLGLLPAQAIMQDKLQALGYTEVEQDVSTILGPAGLRFRGHQFRYSSLVEETPLQCVWRIRSKRMNTVQNEGYAKARILASYVHAHWASHPAIAENLIESALASPLST
ncbi:MAG: cobyrinate a,c-diamide synthase [Proteobacteria bacterium]|nr:cobyrinate a,c-diamide synthase [Pseudomonadota bacterium]